LACNRRSPPQIHQEKRDVVEHVDARDLFVELHASKQRRDTVEEADVAQVEIAHGTSARAVHGA